MDKRPLLDRSLVVSAVVVGGLYFLLWGVMKLAESGLYSVKCGLFC